jgi:hypothetical protein
MATDVQTWAEQREAILAERAANCSVADDQPEQPDEAGDGTPALLHFAESAPETITPADLAEVRAARDTTLKASEALIKAQGVEEYLAARLSARYGLAEDDRVDGDTGAITRA